MKKALTIAMMIVGLYVTRAALPSPGGYMTRIQWLEGYKGLNCAGFVLNAHGDARLSTLGALTDPLPLHRGLNGKLRIIADLPSRTDLHKVNLVTGDVVTFANGGHVAIYLDSNRWVDSDFRRGTVAEFSLADRNGDDWFAGPVRVLRWN